MFTGLIQSLGNLKALGDNELMITYPTVGGLQGVTVGDSVAVDGICLTVTHLIPEGFVADVSAETLARSTLGQHQEMVTVNLEAALVVGDRLGGHFVTGHVDGMGCLEETSAAATGWEMSFTAPPRVGHYVVPKGSIAINGISLTVAACNPDGTWFKVAVVPHTFENTTLHSLPVGCPVNLEGDILGKYVERFLHPRGSQSYGGDEITGIFLREHGYGVSPGITP